MSSHLAQILESGLTGLDDLLAAGEQTSPDYVYAKLIRSYLVSDINAMEQQLEAISPDATLKPIADLGRLRLAIRKLEVSTDLIDACEETNTVIWRGEVQFVKAMACEIRDDFESAARHYELAQKFFLLDGLKKRPLKSRYNAVAARSHINPDATFIYEYQTIAQQAKELGLSELAGTCYHTLAREFQRAGALELALRTINEGILELKGQMYGTYQYYLALCQRCDLLLDLDYTEAARIDFQEASFSQHIEVKGALKVLAGKIKAEDAMPVDVSDPRISASWKERIKASAVANLSLLEQDLIESLADAPKDKYALIQKIYGGQGNFFQKENNLKQLLHRLKRKKGDLVGFADGHYFLKDAWK